MNFINLAHGAFAMAAATSRCSLMQTGRRSVPGLPAARLHRGRRWSARCWSARSTGRCTASRTSTRCCSPSAWCSWRWRRSTTSSARAADHPAARMAERPHRGRRGALCSAWALPALHHRGVRGAHGGAAARSCRRRASAAGCARQSTTRGWRPAWASTSTSCSCRPSRSARASRASAARSAPSPRHGPDLPAQVHDLFPDRGRRRRHRRRSPVRCWPRCCSASPTSLASTSSRRWAPSPSTS